MSDLLPYENHLQQQWTDIPLPEEDIAWADMRRRLEEDDDNRFFFWWRPGCAWWGLLLVLTGLGLWIARPDKKPEHKNGETVNDSTVALRQHTPAQGQSNHETPADENNNKSRSGTTDTPNGGALIKDSRVPFRNKQLQDQNTNGSYALTSSSASKEKTAIDPMPLIDTTYMSVTTAQTQPSIEPDTATRISAGRKTDTTRKADTASTVKKPDPADSSKDRLFFSTGIGIQQQLPIAGQKATPYNSAGRKSSIADYIPSVYLRLHKKDKWFVQAEFRYGAPQYSKEFLYQQTSIRDTGINPVFTTRSSAKLKKTFYHQLPLSFHYYVMPGWSVGGGVIWNKFYAAVSDKEIIKRNDLNQTESVLFKGISSIKKDTSGTFANSYFQAIIETQYKWKRFSIGARYAFGLQPYIRFTLPGAGTKEEKNTSVQTFLRFELWRSKRE